jgi:hypothetical protein
LSEADIRTLGVLGCYIDRQGYCFPAVTTIASQLGKDRRNVQRSLRKLIALGYVQREHTKRASRGGWGRNRYWVQFPPLASSPQVTQEHEMSEAVPPTISKRRAVRADASPGTQLDASHTPHKLEHLIKTSENKSGGHAHLLPLGKVQATNVRQLRGQLNSPIDAGGALVQRGKKLAMARSPSKSMRKDYMTEIANLLSKSAALDIASAWKAIMSLPRQMQEEIEAGKLGIDAVIAEIRRSSL